MKAEKAELLLLAAFIGCVVIVGRNTGKPAAPEPSPSPTPPVRPAAVIETYQPLPPVSPAPEPTPVPTDAPDESGIVETTISGGMTVKNESGYFIDTAALTADGAGITLPKNEPQVLIFHTHSSEAYTQAGLDKYEPSDTNRTEDQNHNIIRVGDELTRVFEEAGLIVIHDRGVYDYPSYTGSYTRSGAAAEEYLADYPSIKVVIDLHRDALGDEDVVYKTMAEEDGVVASQVMMLVGTDASGLEHPNWQKNLTLVLYLQKAVSDAHPTLMRPVDLVMQRYNQQLSPGMFILEVGSSGNTLQEALAAVRLYGKAAGEALVQLVEE